MAFKYFKWVLTYLNRLGMTKPWYVKPLGLSLWETNLIMRNVKSVWSCDPCQMTDVLDSNSTMNSLNRESFHRHSRVHR